MIEGVQVVARCGLSRVTNKRCATGSNARWGGGGGGGAGGSGGQPLWERLCTPAEIAPWAATPIAHTVGKTGLYNRQRDKFHQLGLGWGTIANSSTLTH